MYPLLLVFKYLALSNIDVVVTTAACA